MEQSGLAAGAALDGGPQGWMRANKHFVVAASILALATAAWFIAIKTKLIFPVKRPVPWAVGQQIGEDGRWLNLATRFGPFRMVENTDQAAIEQLGPGGGEIIYSSDVLEALGISGQLGKKELAERSSNWYVSRRYLDERKIEGKSVKGAYALWYLDLTYYTGSVDLVPHTPIACLQAAGRVITGESEVTFDVTVPDRWKAWWNGKVTFSRVTSESPRGQRNRSVDYYAFCLNGKPETDRLAVRRKLTYPWVPHCYFAKIQFAPRTNTEIDSIEEADRAAGEFVRHFLPEVLKGMPTPDDVEKLKSLK
ncbi:MAG: hypothetical protein NTV86_21915 [Planctomycetota bacterium]|nr:hypothetical protein [Planctomycetota bacterium]